MLKKRLYSAFLLVFLISSLILTFFTTTTLAANNSIISITDKEDVFVYDKDNVIDDDIERELNNLLVELEHRTQVEFAVISIPSLNDLTIEEYANKLFNTLGIGKKGADNGLLLLFSKTDNKVRLEIGRGLEGCLNDGKCGRILDNYFVPYRAENKYSEATKLTVNAVLSVISEEYDIQIEGVENVTIPEDDESLPTWLIVLLIILLVILIFLSDGHSGGGGFFRGSSGGFSGGGGFGGGFSGGGGASR